MQKSILLGLFPFANHLAPGRTKLTGKVVDATKQPIPYASVSVMRTMLTP